MLVSRDPFARTELHRETVLLTSAFDDCWNCGRRNGFGNLYRYRNESDGGRKYPISGKFCSVECMRTYHG